MRSHWRHRPPPWWPVDEPWPPRHGPPWRRGPRFFLPRLAGLFAIVISLTTWGGIALVRAIVGDDAGGRFPAWVAGPFVFAVIAFVFLMTMRRVGRPMGHIVAAAERVASGDFTVRVAEYGPPWLRSVAAAFNSMTARLELQQRQRRDLMADIAHELRTPLAVMQGRLEGMLDGVYPRDEPHVTQVLDDARLLARLVEDLRTLAHSESGTLKLEKELTELPALIEDALTSCEPEADARGVQVTARCPPEFPLVDLDPLRIREVVTNLVSNAVRYSPNGSTVRVDAEADATHVTLRVSDTGPGISPEDLPHIFDRFYKGAASTGSGLGLTIARSLVGAHSGTLTAESRLGAGTTMSVRLPLRLD